MPSGSWCSTCALSGSGLVARQVLSQPWWCSRSRWWRARPAAVDQVAQAVDAKLGQGAGLPEGPGRASWRSWSAWSAVSPYMRGQCGDEAAHPGLGVEPQADPALLVGLGEGLGVLAAGQLEPLPAGRAQDLRLGQPAQPAIALSGSSSSPSGSSGSGQRGSCLSNQSWTAVARWHGPRRWRGGTSGPGRWWPGARRVGPSGIGPTAGAASAGDPGGVEVDLHGELADAEQGCDLGLGLAERGDLEPARPRLRSHTRPLGHPAVVEVEQRLQPRRMRPVRSHLRGDHRVQQPPVHRRLGVQGRRRWLQPVGGGPVGGGSVGASVVIDTSGHSNICSNKPSVGHRHFLTDRSHLLITVPTGHSRRTVEGVGGNAGRPEDLPGHRKTGFDERWNCYCCSPRF